jgi:hypothetical protein
LKEPALDEEKKRCEPDEPFRIVEGLGSRFVGLKLSREGFTGILPVMTLACRNDASLILSWFIDTAPRPNSFPAMDENPERTCSSLNARSKFEKRPPPSGENPSWKRPNSPAPTALYRPPHPPYHG